MSILLTSVLVQIVLPTGGLFGTALAPIAGVYGFLPGMVAGWLHLAVVQNIGSVHGGMNLYNNGFSAGVVAAFKASTWYDFTQNVISKLMDKET